MSLKNRVHPHRRYNPLTGDWVLVSPQRINRPWRGKAERAHKDDGPLYDANCYLCPGNHRAGKQKNPVYRNTFVFANDFAALIPKPPGGAHQNNGLFKTEAVKGACRVICFSPLHNLTLAEMTAGEIQKVIDAWIVQFNDLGKHYRWVQVFENKGEMMGCSNSHPHGQIWASDELPNEPFKENREQLKYHKQHRSVLLRDYLKMEIAAKERIIVENEHWAVLAPFWAVWPFETMLLPKKRILRLPDAAEAEREALAGILKSILVRYDNLFQTSFPYTMGWHGAPFGNGDFGHWQLHAHFYPPLLKSATVKKFMVGYEMLAEAQRDITPEQAAERMQNISEIHYKKT